MQSADRRAACAPVPAVIHIYRPVCIYVIRGDTRNLAEEILIMPEKRNDSEAARTQRGGNYIDAANFRRGIPAFL